VDVLDHIEIVGPKDQVGTRSSGGILAQTLPESTISAEAGDGGNAFVRAGSITLRDEDSDGVAIAAATRGNGNAGNVFVEAGDVVISGEFAQIHAISLGTDQFPEVIGSAGNVEVHARLLQLSDGGAVSVLADSKGSAGQLRIVADRVELNQGSITAASKGSGATGGVSIRARERVSIRSGGEISATATLTDGGSISVVANAIDIESAKIDAEAARNGGNVLLIAPDILLREATLSAQAINGSGGNLSLFSLPQRGDAVLSADSMTSLIAKSQEGRGGNIRIFSPNPQIDDAQINASGKFEADSGSVDVTTAQTDLVGSLVPLRVDLQPPFAQLHDCCESVIGRDMSNFTRTGVGGLPLDPGGWSPMMVPTERNPTSRPSATPE